METHHHPPLVWCFSSSLQRDGGVLSQHPLGGAAFPPPPLARCSTCCFVVFCDGVEIDRLTPFRGGKARKHRHSKEGRKGTPPKREGDAPPKGGRKKAPPPRRRMMGKQHHPQEGESNTAKTERGTEHHHPKKGAGRSTNPMEEGRKNTAPKEDEEENNTQKVEWAPPLFPIIHCSKCDLEVAHFSVLAHLETAHFSPKT